MTQDEIYKKTADKIKEDIQASIEKVFSKKLTFPIRVITVENELYKDTVIMNKPDSEGNAKLEIERIFKTPIELIEIKGEIKFD